MDGMTAIDYIKELHREINQLQHENERLQSKIKELECELYDLKHSKDSTNA